MQEDEFDEFYRVRFGPLVRVIFLQTGDLSRAEGCAQEAFLRAWQRRRVLDGGDPVRWVTKVAWRLAVSEWRTNRRLQRTLQRTGIPVSPVEAAPEEVLYARQLVSRLPDAQRSVVVLHYFDDLSVADVAELLDVPPGTVKSRLARARDRLREIVTEEGDRSGRAG